MIALHARSQDSYYVNNGNDQRNPELAEFGTDLGGHLPFRAYDEGTSGFWQDIGNWDFVGAGSLRGQIRDLFTNFSTLDTELQANATGASSGDYPSTITTTGPVAPTPLQFDPWWFTGSGNYLTVTNYRVNEGYVQIVHKTDRTGAPDPAHILVYNHGAHHNDFGSQGFAFDLWANAPVWVGSGNDNLTFEQQAVERGDVLVRVVENFSGSIWIALQRNHDAERFLRVDYFPNVLGETPGKTYLYGISFGALTSGIQALLMGDVYAAAANTYPADFGYHFSNGDWGMLRSHYGAATGFGTPDRMSASSVLTGYHQFIDLLGIRFDQPETMDPQGITVPSVTQDGWDVAAFSLLFRTAHSTVPQVGLIGAEDDIINWHWQDSLRDPGSPRHVADYEPRIVQFMAHSSVAGIASHPQLVKPGFNEFSVFDGNEWADVLNLPGSPGTAQPLVPSSAPAIAEVYPDPYTHTFRHTRDNAEKGKNGADILDVLDINPSAGSEVIGQGVYPGRFDNLIIDDLDDDGMQEVVFGNVDGFVHVLQLEDEGTDNPTLVDEWRSERIGYGCYAMSHKPGTSRIDVADSRGTIHKLSWSAANGYTMVAKVLADNSVGKYDGVIERVHRFNFHPDFGGQEYMYLNEQLDWVLARGNGNLIQRLFRHETTVSPGHSALVLDWLGDSDGMPAVVVPSLDGHLWSVFWDDTASPKQLRCIELLTFTNRALYRIEPIDADGDGLAEGFLLFGRNNSEPDTDVIMGYDFTGSTPTLRWEIPTQISLADAQGLVFSWIDPPSQASSTWTFAVGAGQDLETFAINSFPTPPVSLATQIVPPRNPDTPPPGGPVDTKGGMTAITAFPLPGAVQPTQYRLMVATNNGRFWVLTPDLEYVRETDQIDPSITTGVQPWYSNETFGHTLTMDGEDDGNLGIRLYAAEFAQAFQFGQHRIAELHIDNTGSVTTTPHLDQVKRVISESPTFFEYRNYDGMGNTPYFLAEAGVVFWDSDAGKVREFCNVGIHPGDATQALGGYIFEYDRTANDYTVLQGFYPPDNDPRYYSRGGTDWWYPRIGTFRLSGQVANNLQGVSGLGNYHGTSMIRDVLLPDPDTQVLKKHVVTGTLGGYVQAIHEPSSTRVQNGNVQLHYSSVDMGWYAVGLDAANLDGDAEDEIVVGTMVDDGSFDDWVNGAQYRNRGGLYILDVDSATGEWKNPIADPALQITGDDLDNSPRSGLGCGVLAVKIDDVNNDGTFEIWASDAVGHLYLFQQVGGAWETLYRSEDLSPYPGLYQNIYPVKDSLDGKTKRLFVVSGGYIMAFVVKPDDVG